MENKKIINQNLKILFTFVRYLKIRQNVVFHSFFFKLRCNICDNNLNNTQLKGKIYSILVYVKFCGKFYENKDIKHKKPSFIGFYSLVIKIHGIKTQ